MEHTNELLIVLLATQLVVIVGLLLVEMTLRRLLSAVTLQRSRPVVPPQDSRATDAS